MTGSSAETVRETYRLALQQSLQKKLKTQKDWDRYVAIASQSAERVDQENAAYRRDLMARLAEARAVVLREHEARHLTLKPPMGAESSRPLSADAVEYLAGERVRIDHAQRLTAIRKDEIHALKEMREDIRKRDAQSQSVEHRRGQAKEAFALTQQTSHHQRSRS